MLDTAAVEHVEPLTSELRTQESRWLNSPTSLRDLVRVLVLRRRRVFAIVGGLLLACLLYCLVAPSQYEAKARVALRTAPVLTLNVDGSDVSPSESFASSQMQLETLASVLRSDRLAWKVILEQRLYQAPAFMGRFAVRFPDFRPEISNSLIFPAGKSVHF